MSYGMNIAGNGGRYGYASGHTASAADSIYAGVHASGTYRTTLNMAKIQMHRKISVKSAVLTMYPRTFYASKVRTTVYISIGTTAGWDASSGGTLVASATVSNIRQPTEFEFNEDGRKLLAQYLTEGTQFYLYIKGASGIQGVAFYGYAPDSDYKAYIPDLTILYNYSTVRFAADGEWKECMLYFGADGEWKECEGYYGDGGAWKEL